MTRRQQDIAVTVAAGLAFVAVIAFYGWGLATGRLQRARQIDLDALERRVERLERAR